MDGWENARESFQICSILSSLIHLPSFHSDFQLHTVVFTFDLSSYRLNKSPARRSESCWPVRMCYTNKVWLIDKVFHVRVVLLLLRNVGYFMTCGVKEDSYLPDTLYICSHKAARLQHLCIRVCVCVCHDKCACGAAGLQQDLQALWSIQQRLFKTARPGTTPHPSSLLLLLPKLLFNPPTLSPRPPPPPSLLHLLKQHPTHSAHKG